MTDRERLRDAMVTYLIPAHMHEGIEAYVFDHRPVGSFLTAVFENDFEDAVAHADDINEQLPVLRAYMWLVHNDCPSACHGSKAKVKAWLDRDGPTVSCRTCGQAFVDVSRGMPWDCPNCKATNVSGAPPDVPRGTSTKESV